MFPRISAQADQLVHPETTDPATDRPGWYGWCLPANYSYTWRETTDERGYGRIARFVAYVE